MGQEFEGEYAITSRDATTSLLDVGDVTMAWFGQREGGSDRIIPGTVLGEPKQFLREAVDSTDVEDAKGGPVLRAVNSGEVQMIDDIRNDDQVCHWRGTTSGHGTRPVKNSPSH